MGDIKKRVILFVLIMLVLIPAVFAKQGHMSLLAVSQSGDTYFGSPADLYLEIREGEGRVFLDTYPLTKLDTQISMRLSKEIACDYLGVDCSKNDFIYTIKADSNIIGGPSAGAAATVLTISLLKDISIDENFAITGTINSGGVIGAVGGIKEKIDAAKMMNMTKVFIPEGESISKLSEESLFVLEENDTVKNAINLTKYAEDIGIELIEVSDISDAFYRFSGESIKQEKNFTVDKYYEQTMKEIAEELCNRTKELKTEILNKKINITSALNLTNNSNEDNILKAQKAFEEKKYYSSASFCFSSNIKYTYIILKSYNMSEDNLIKNITESENKIKQIEKEFEKKDYKTITALETYIVVKERLEEAKDYLQQSIDNLNNTDTAVSNLAYARERINSAYTWSKFSNNPGKKFNIDKELLKNSCMEKITEAQERYEYVNMYIPDYLADTKTSIDESQKELENGNYELCLSKAAKAKAESDAVLSVFGVEESQLENLVDKKIESAKSNIARQTSKGIFPMLSYSYYEYAISLKETELVSSLVYSEYSIELSNLDMYLSQREIPFSNEPFMEKNTSFLIVLSFLGGIVIGFLVYLSIGRIFIRRYVQKHIKKSSRKRR